MATKRIRLPGPPPTAASASTPLTIESPVEQPFLKTREHARFIEFAEACSRYRYIGVCHGRPGVGKTRSAREFSDFPDLREYGACSAVPAALGEKVARCRAIFYTVSVSNTPKTLDMGLGVSLTKLGYARLTVAAGSLDGVTYDAARTACPLVIIDEADRLSIKSLEHLRDLSDPHESPHFRWRLGSHDSCGLCSCFSSCWAGAWQWARRIIQLGGLRAPVSSSASSMATTCTPSVSMR